MFAAQSVTTTKAQEWTILDDKGESTITFDSFIDLDLRSEGQALSYPVEEGGFMNYNKVQSPKELHITLATQGTSTEFENTLNQLEGYQKNTVKLFILSPGAVYDDLTLESYSYKRTQSSGANLLIVELILKEIREVQTQIKTTVITKPKNPTSASNKNTGKQQAQEVDKSILEHIYNWF